MSKKFFIVFGHHNYKPGSSFNACIKDEILLEAKRLGHSIDLINLSPRPTRNDKTNYLSTSWFGLN